MQNLKLKCPKQENVGENWEGPRMCLLKELQGIKGKISEETE